MIIDGRSGSGKSTLASAWAAENPGAQLVRLDDIYPGWDGLAAASEHVVEWVLNPSAFRWQRWSWKLGEAAEWHELDPGRPIIVEGAGALTRRSAPLATTRVWTELDPATRKQRALARDGETYAPHWDRWAAQEDLHIAAENPRALADLVIEGNEALH